MKQISAVVYPVPVSLVRRLLKEKKNVFVKYLPRTTNISLQPGNKVVFYASHANKQVVGEGIATKIEFLTPDEAILKYGDKLFLSRDELLAYTAQQPSRHSSKKMLTIVLTNLRKYKKEIPYPRPLTMAGEYLTRQQYRRLVG